MPAYDWYCKTCKEEEKDIWYHRASDVPKKRKCKACLGNTMVQDFANKGRNQIHLTHSSLYGKFEPGVAEYINSYSDKQRIMKKYNIQESNDPVKGSRCHRVGPPKTPTLQSDWADAPSNAHE